MNNVRLLCEETRWN